MTETTTGVPDHAVSPKPIRRATNGSKKRVETYQVTSHPVSPGLIERAERLYRERRRRDARMGGSVDLFGEPSWDMLLDLFIAQGRQRPVSVSSACIASSTPQSTALRYVGLLEKVGLIRRAKDPSDGRRQYLELTEAGFTSMQTCLAEER
jgi:hypothetical protein